MGQEAYRKRAITGPPSSSSGSSRSRSDSSNPMSISSMLNDETDGDRDTVFRRRSQSLQLPPPTRPLNLSRQQTDPFIYAQQYQVTTSFAVQEPPENPSSPTSSDKSSTTRAPRPKYQDEQIFFIWYHRTDLSLAWDEVLYRYREQFQQSREKTGLQCKFYRLLGDWGVEKVREQVRNSQRSNGDSIGAYGVIQRTWHRFPWMRLEHIGQKPLPQFRDQGKFPLNSSRSTCKGCTECNQTRKRKT